MVYKKICFSNLLTFWLPPPRWRTTCVRCSRRKRPTAALPAPATVEFLVAASNNACFVPNAVCCCHGMSVSVLFVMIFVNSGTSSHFCFCELALKFNCCTACSTVDFLYNFSTFFNATIV